MGKESGSNKASRAERTSHHLSGYNHASLPSQHHWRRRRRCRKDYDRYPLASSMNAFLTRKKNRPRQSSVSSASELGASKPYEELGPSPRSPIHVGTTSQGLRGSVPSVISAPITNPTLTTDGTELNLFSMHRSRQERDQLYNSHPANRPASPMNSPSTAESFANYSESDKTYSHHRSTTSASETSVSSGRSPSVSDFGGYHSQRKGSNQQTARPTSHATTRSDRMSMNTRSIIFDSPSQHHHSTHIGNALHAARYGPAEEFHFPRPDNDEEIEVLFQEIKRSLDLGDNMPNMTIDQKWQMVYNAEHLRWSEERRREQQTKRQAETGQSAPFVEGSPEWYIQRFMDRTITPKQASSLEVSLRSNQLRSNLSKRPPPFTEDFSAGLSTSFQYKALLSLHKPLHRYQERATRGDWALCLNFVATLNPAFRRNEDVQLEFGIAKCIKTILNNQVSRRRRPFHLLNLRWLLVRSAGSIYPPSNRQPSRCVVEYPTPADKEGDNGCFNLLHLRTGLPGVSPGHQWSRNSQHYE